MQNVMRSLPLTEFCGRCDHLCHTGTLLSLWQKPAMYRVRLAEQKITESGDWFQRSELGKCQEKV